MDCIVQMIPGYAKLTSIMQMKLLGFSINNAIKGKREVMVNILGCSLFQQLNPPNVKTIQA